MAEQLDERPRRGGNNAADLIGRTFTRLTVRALAPKVGPQRRWVCVCSCGRCRTVIVKTAELLNGHTRSCGCLARELSKARATKHGQCGSPTFNAWMHMLGRCYTSSNQDFKHYGGRGISVCAQWRGSFTEFLADMGVRPAGLTLERRDVNGNYELSNCVWESRKRQARNQRRTIYLEFQNQRLPLADWAERFFISTSTLHARIHDYGWSVERALTEPVGTGVANRWARNV